MLQLMETEEIRDREPTYQKCSKIQVISIYVTYFIQGAYFSHFLFYTLPLPIVYISGLLIFYFF